MSSNRTLIGFLLAVAVVGGFWFLALGPKRAQVSELDKKADQEQAAVAEQKQAIATGVEARRDFPRDYQQLVLLGKAVPNGEDSASMLVQLNRVADRAGVQFRQLELDQSAAMPAPLPAPAPGDPSVQSPVPEAGTSTSTSTSTSTPAPAPAPATEASVASLPIGATVGSAGLGVVPYGLQFEGDFFQIADFLQGLDRFVETKPGNVAVDGQLMTVNGFSLSQDTKKGFPSLAMSLSVTTYVTPSDQGLTAGATPAAPAATIAAAPTSAPATTSTTAP
jgi:Tfp pilus assembly protein PilO